MDSYLPWVEARTGGFGNWFPVSYSILVRALLNIWHNPASIVLFQIVALTAAVSFFVSKLTSNIRVAVLAPLLFFIWPQAGASTVLLSRDVLFCSTFLVIAGYLIVELGNARPSARSSAVPILISLCFLVILRWNGVIIGMLVVFLIGLLAQKLRPIVLPIIGVIFGCVILLFPPLSTNSGGKSIRTGIQAIDIAWGLREDRTSFNQYDLDFINENGGVDLWSQSQRDCNNSAMPLLFDVFERGQHWETIMLESKRVRNIWIRHAIRSPKTFIEGRLCRMRGLIPLGSSWPQVPVVAHYTAGDHIVGTDYWLRELKEPPQPPLFKNSHVVLAGGYVNSYGYSRLGRLLATPLPYLVLLILRAYHRRSLSRRDRILVALSFFVVVSVFIGGAGYEPRYVWPATAVLFLVSLIDISEWLERKIRDRSNQ